MIHTDGKPTIAHYGVCDEYEQGVCPLCGEQLPHAGDPDASHNDEPEHVEPDDLSDTRYHVEADTRYALDARGRRIKRRPAA